MTHRRFLSAGGGAATTLRTGVDCEAPAEILSDGVYLYWLHWDDSAVRRMWVGGGPVSMIATGGRMNVRQGPVQDDWWLYWGDVGGTHRVVKWTPGSVFTIVAGASPNAGLAVDETYVYWTEGGPGTGSVKRKQKDGGGVIEVLRNATNGIEE